MTYDLKQLRDLGKRRKKLLDQIEALRPEIEAEVVLANAAGVEQKEIAGAAHYTRETIRQMCLTPEQREAEREARRSRTRKG